MDASMRKMWIAAATLASRAVAGADIAAAQGQGAGMSRRQGQGLGMSVGRGVGAGQLQMMQERGEILDADGDGLIQRGEQCSRRKRLFYAMDADGDGVLTRSEYMAVQVGAGDDPHSRGLGYDEMQAARAEDFNAMDADDDGVLSRERSLAHGVDLFDAANADRILSLESATA